MQVISEERGSSLDKVNVDVLGTAKKVYLKLHDHLSMLSHACQLRVLNFLWGRSLFLLMTQYFYMEVEIRNRSKKDVKR